MVAATKEAATKLTAIDMEAGQSGTDAGIGGSVVDEEWHDPTSTYSITIERDRDGTKITIIDTDNPADDDPEIRNSRRPWTWVADAPCTLAPWMRMPTAT